MMNKEMLHRIKTAGEYQRKAIRALFPEEMAEHLDAIEKEVKRMVMEVAARDRHSHEQTSKVKKVDIV